MLQTLFLTLALAQPTGRDLPPSDWKVLGATDGLGIADIDARPFDRGAVVRNPKDLALAVGRKTPEEALALVEKQLKAPKIDFDKHTVIMLALTSDLESPKFKREPLEVRGKTLTIRWSVASVSGKKSRSERHYFYHLMVVDRFDGDIVFEPKVRLPLIVRAEREKYLAEHPYRVLESLDRPLVPHLETYTLGKESGRFILPPAENVVVLRDMAQARTALKQKSDALAGVKIRRDFRIFSAFEKQMLVSIDLGYRRLGTKVKFKELAEKDGKLIVTWEEIPPAADKIVPFVPSGAAFLAKRYDGPVVFEPPVRFQKLRGDDVYHADGKPRGADEGFTEIYPPKGSDLKLYAHARFAPHLKAESPGVTVAYFSPGMDSWHRYSGRDEWLQTKVLPALKVRDIDWSKMMLVYVTPEGKGGPGCPFQVESIKKTGDGVVVRGRYDASVTPPKYTLAAGELLLVERVKGAVTYEQVGGPLLPLERKKGGNHPEFEGSDLRVYAAIPYSWDPAQPARQRVVRSEAETDGFKPLNMRPAMSDAEITTLLGIDRMPDYNTQMLIHFTGGVLPNKAYRFRVKSLKIKAGELVVGGEIFHPTGYHEPREHHPGNMLLVQRFDGPVRFEVEHANKLEYPEGTKITQVKVLASAGHVEVKEVTDKKVEGGQFVVRSKEELAKALRLADAEAALTLAQTALKTDTIDFAKHTLLVFSGGVKTESMTHSWHGGHLFKNKHYWTPENRTHFTAVNGRLNVFHSAGYVPDLKYGYKLQVGLVLIERYDGEVRFIRMYSPDRVFKDGDPLESK
ncbi:MAG: hypothetical protein U0793_19260 [Gemmataceae bacterium]